MGTVRRGTEHNNKIVLDILFLQKNIKHIYIKTAIAVMGQTPSIKKNFAYKSLLTVSNYLMAFITFPYVSRVLGVENIGLVNFVDNTISYFILFASMGISTLGVREIAKVKESPAERNKIFSNILGLNLLFTFITLILYLLAVTIVPKFEQHSDLFYIGASKILFTAFLIEWFYTGIEDFKYITVRSIIIKAIYVFAVFICVKDSNDYKLYFYLTIAITLLNAFINIIYSRIFVRIKLSELFQIKFLNQNIILGVYSIMTSMYLTFNVMYLGIVSNNIQVGYYTTAYKLYSVILGFFTAFTNVMLPRMSSLVANNDKEHFKSLVIKSFSAMVMFSVPLTICSMILAPQIVHVLSGPGYDGAVEPMRIIMPAILFVGIAQVLAVQVLIPLHKDKILFRTSLLGAVVSIVINLLFVHNLQSVGSAVVLVSSEFVVTLSYIVYIMLKTDFRFPWIEIVKNIALSIPSALSI